MTRKEILDGAAQCVCADREQSYGNPESNFSLIAAYWTTYKGIEFTAHDIGMMMALLKVARIQTGRYKADSYIDGAGYLACAGELAQTQTQEWGDTD